jgi:GTP-binding protein HflX
MPKKPSPTEPPSERAFLVGIEMRGAHQLLRMEDSLSELALLADTAGMSVVGEITQKVSRPDPNTFIGSGKVAELKDFVEETLANTVVFDEELSPRHQRELEGLLGETVKVLDRTALILDIFAQHAHTREGAMQVELAQYEYRLPRLTRQWTHLARQAGGGGGRSGGVGGVGLRGPGETQLEVDRREISRKIAYLKGELEKIRAHRGRHRAQRKRSAIPVIAIVGYTNAGKSTLLNQLTGADVYAADQLFATLDPTTRRVELPGGKSVLVTDTVGFIQKLPTTLVAAFRATLEEIAEADLLLHVVDLAHPNALEQAEAVKNTLAELEIGDIPIVTVLNKVDRLGGLENVEPRLTEFPNVTAVSALTGLGFEQMLQKIQAILQQSLDPIDVRVPYTEGQLISVFHEQGVVELVEHEESGVRLKGRVPRRVADRFKPFQIRRRQRQAGQGGAQ